MNGVTVLRMDRIAKCVTNPINSLKFAEIKENRSVNKLCVPALITMMMQKMRTKIFFDTKAR